MSDMYDDSGCAAEDIAVVVAVGSFVKDMSDATDGDPSCSTIDNTAAWGRISKRGKSGLTGVISIIVRVATAIWIIAMIAALLYVGIAQGFNW